MVHYREIWIGVVVYAKVQGLVKSESPRLYVFTSPRTFVKNIAVNSNNSYKNLKFSKNLKRHLSKKNWDGKIYYCPSIWSRDQLFLKFFVYINRLHQNHPHTILLSVFSIKNCQNHIRSNFQNIFSKQLLNWFLNYEYLYCICMCLFFQGGISWG